MPLTLPIALLSMSLAYAQGDEMVTPPFERFETSTEAPFGNEMPSAIVNYSRAAPMVAIAGRPTVEGVEAMAEMGFALMIDLRQPDEEGVAEEASRAKEIGLKRISLPMPGDNEGIDSFLLELVPLLNGELGYPVLLNCGSANRAAAAWALYRARSGVPLVVAIEEGCAAGLTSKEDFVRRSLR